jgi:hypothetical protein
LNFRSCARHSPSAWGTATYSVECFLGDDDTARFIDGICVESIARHLFEQVLIGLKHFDVSALEVSTLGLIP